MMMLRHTRGSLQRTVRLWAIFVACAVVCLLLNTVSLKSFHKDERIRLRHHRQHENVYVSTLLSSGRNNSRKNNNTRSDLLNITTSQHPPPPPHTRMPTNNHTPELFLERLNRLLPETDVTRRYTVDEIAHLERELLSFHIPRPVTILVPASAPYISIQWYRWLFHNQAQNTENNKCPHCFLRFDKLASGEAVDDYTPYPTFWVNNSHHDNGTADVLMDVSCPAAMGEEMKRNQRQRWQVTVSGCGESQAGSGAAYARGGGRQQFDYHAGFEKVAEGLFQTTYAHLHLSPDNRLGFPELWNVTDMAKLLLSSSSSRRDSNNNIISNTKNNNLRPALEPEPAMFIHNNCRGKRGQLMSAVQQLEATTQQRTPLLVARYGCLRNKDKPKLALQWEDVPCPQRDPAYVFHNDCFEPTRDAGKTVLSSMHKFTAALENTLSVDYFTEKRWQALLAGSVPIVWDNHNSLDSLPDPSAALILRHNVADNRQLAKDLLEKLAYYKENDTAYQEDFFAWKKQGALRASFLRKLFLSSDFLPCRICEYVAHHHVRSDNTKKN